MSYNSFQIAFSDVTNGTLTILPNTVDNYNTSLQFIGKNAPNYASALGSNFLHLLENFSAPTDQPPQNPIQGQLWYDNLKRKIYIRDTDWKPVNGVWQQTTEPGLDNTPSPETGDIWVNTEAHQLSIYNGTSFTLIGPNYSSSTRTGSYPDAIKDNFGDNHFVIKQYVNDEVVEIISADTFTPQQVISGFTSIKSGVNLTSSRSATFNGLAESAKKLYVTTPNVEYVNANYFVRNDINNTINAALTVKNGVIIGSGASFRMYTTGTGINILSNTTKGGKFIIRTTDNDSVARDTVTITASQDTQTPAKVAISGQLFVTSSSIFYSSLSATTATFSGNLTVGKNINVVGVSTFSNSVNFNKTITIGSASTTTLTPAILPAISGYYDLGSSTRRFSTVHASIFKGALDGTANTANSLTNATEFKINGHIQTTANLQYKGARGTYTFATILSPSAISDQTEITELDTTDQLLSYSPGTDDLSKISAANFIAQVTAGVIPPGIVVPFAGIDIPQGWLLCDGSEYQIIDYPLLYASILLTYGIPTDPENFLVPDFRGKGAIGYDNMGGTAANIVTGANTPNPIAAALGSAPLVTGGKTTATNTGVTGFGGAVGAKIANVMNPYLAMNFIIKV
jgi:microcystin-dependent protein